MANLEFIIPPLPRVTRGKALIFGADPKGNYLLYPNGNSVILRDLKDASKNDIYTQHSTTVHVAKYSPSGFYIASADKNGKTRIWDTTNLEHILKNEFQPFSGPINDLAWTSDNQRMLVGGTGRSQFGAVFNAETGTSVGEIMGVSKSINAVDFRPVRPYRAIVGTDEGSVVLYAGPPFSLKSLHKLHQSFLNIVAYHPGGDFFISVGSDGKIFIYNGDDASIIGEPDGPGHKGGIYGASFSKCGGRLITVSADKTMKLWNAGDKTLTFISEYKMDKMLFGCSWVQDTIVVVTLDGFLYLFDAPTELQALPEPREICCGHTVGITCASYNRQFNCLVTASADASMALWDMKSRMAKMLTGSELHKSKVQSLTLTSEFILSVGFDDRCILSSLADKQTITSIKLPSQPHSIGVFPDSLFVVVACDQHMVLLQVNDNRLVILDEKPVDVGSCTLAVSPTTGLTVVCCTNEQMLVYKIQSGSFCEATLANKPANPQLWAAFSPDGSMIAFAGADQMITVHSIDDVGGLPTLKRVVDEWWKKHRARVTAIAWSPNGRRLATGSLDTCITVWYLDDQTTSTFIQAAHPMSNSTSLSWIDDNHLLSTAQDGSIRQWQID